MCVQCRLISGHKVDSAMLDLSRMCCNPSQQAWPGERGFCGICLSPTCGRMACIELVKALLVPARTLSAP